MAARDGQGERHRRRLGAARDRRFRAPWHPARGALLRARRRCAGRDRVPRARRRSRCARRRRARCRRRDLLHARAGHVRVDRGRALTARAPRPPRRAPGTSNAATKERRSMAQAVRIHKTGGPEVLGIETVDVGAPGPGEARVRNTAVGVNYIDTYHRSGLYPLPLPSGLGTEGAGVVEAVGAGVTDIKPGDRVAYCVGPVGAYASERVMPADRLVKLPEGIGERTAAAMMLKGLTVQYLFRQTYRLSQGETILFHAAAGGVGLIACQWARALGVTMIGTVGSDAKAELAKAHGCAHTIVYTRENFVDRVKEITG